MAEEQKFKVVDLDDIPDFKRFEIAVNGNSLPIAIGDKIQFPKDDPYLKTVVGVQIDENGIANYIIEWFEDSVFKQNTLSLTELKVLKDNLKQRMVVEMFAHKQEDEDQKSRQRKSRSKVKESSESSNVKEK